MGCPSKSAKEFKALVKDTNLSESYVYSVVHEFQNSSKENENEFPSKEYILNTLEGNNTATSKSEIDYWLENNSTPKEFEVGRNAKKYAESLEKFYNKEAIVIYRKGDGKYVVKVAAPKGKYQVLRIISGAQTGVDTIGLQVAKELGISTKGKAPKRFLREKGYDEVDVREFGVEEITDEEQSDYTSRTGKRDPYTARTELNVRNSDGTVYFYTSADSLGMRATQRSAREWNKPFLINPTPEVLAQWIKDNNIKVLNVAGNRGTKLENPEEVSNTLKSALKLLEESKSTTPSKYTEEEQSILDKAPRNSKGQLLAPNGKVSNLTEKQYAQVRTKAFKNWFGDWENDSENASKVIDENGEPKVIYHHTSQGGFTVFNPEKSDDKLSLFGSSSERVSETYSDDIEEYVPTREEFDTVNRLASALGIFHMSLFINNKKLEGFNLNKDIVANKGDSIIIRNSDEEIIYNKNFTTHEEILDDIFNSLNLSNNIYTYNLFMNLKNPLIIDAKGEYWNNINYNGKVYNTRELSKLAKEKGYDGVIINNVIDIASDKGFEEEYDFSDPENPINISPDRTSDIIIAHKSNQLKSATDNSGEFSTTNNDIYDNKDGLEEEKKEPINIWHSSRENVELSNFAKRPFTLKDFSVIVPSQTDISVGTVGLYNKPKYKVKELTIDGIKYIKEPGGAIINTSTKSYIKADAKGMSIINAFEEADEESRLITFNTVEGAFQYIKSIYSDKDYSEESEENKGDNYIRKFAEADGPTAKAMGSRIEELNVEDWNKDKYAIMKALLIESFRQNPEALKKLLSTGNATLTHNQARGEWKTEFPRILMEVRELLGDDSNKMEEHSYERKSIPTPSRPQEETPVEFNEEESKIDTVEQDIKASSEFLQQVDNLYSSTLIPTTEIREVAEEIVYWISDYITQLQSQEGLLVEKYGKQFESINPILMERIDLVKAIGPKNLLDACKEHFEEAKANMTSVRAIREMNLLLKNWEALTRLASYAFTNVEKFSITYSEGKAEVTEEINDDVDNYNDSNSSADVAEEEGDTQEHWQVESRTLDVLNTMTVKVRMALQECYLLDDDGQIIKSKYGINKRVNPREATNSILRWTQGALDLTDMINKLKEKAGKSGNRWVNQIIEKLESEDDLYTNDIDFQSQFFSTFCKDAQPYCVVVKKNGKYISKIVNELPALKEAMTTVTTQFKIGEHPMFTSDGINKSSFETFKTVINYLVEQNKTKKYEGLNKEEAAKHLSQLSALLGYYATPDMIKEAVENKDDYFKMVKAATYIRDILERNLDTKDYEPFAFKSEEGIYGNTKNFLQPITDRLEDIAVSSVYDSGKMYQSYVTPSYMTRLMQKFKLKGKSFEDFIQEEYGQYSWFKDPKYSRFIEKGWRTAWVRELVLDEDAREIFKHKVQLNFNKHNYMKNMNDTEYTLSLLAEYFAEKAKKGKEDRVPAWFRIPMMSNKPSSEFIRFYSERGFDYKDVLTNKFADVFYQELSRIQTVRQRNYKKTDPEFIKNFDSNGRKFMFMDFMNTYLDGDNSSSELGVLINKKLKGDADNKLDAIEEARLETLAKEVIKETMDTRAKSIVNDWVNKNILEGAKAIENIGSSEEEIISNLENFVWNDTFAAMQIMEMTITDIAYYKDAEDLQKRLAQIHAPGIRGNVNARDYAHPKEKISDGYARTFYLTDFDSLASNIVENIKVIFKRKVEAAKRNGNLDLAAQYESIGNTIVTQFKNLKGDINVADAQGYSSPTSYRKKAHIFGRWSNEAEDVYQNLRKGTYNFNDLKVAFQPLKPFVYTQIPKSSNVSEESAIMDTLKVPIQNKNSEYLLIMADALLQGEDTGQPNMLRAIYEVMEESHYDAQGNYKKDGIDTVQFESTVKSGLMGRININQFLNSTNGEAQAKELMKSSIYNADGKYNETFIHAIPYSDYCIQQEVPEHFKEHFQAHGSQIRFIIPSDLEEFNDNGDPVTYNVEGRKLTAEEFKKEYEENIAENINEDIDNLAKELHLDNKSTLKERNIAISKILQREILSSPRYGVDLLIACSVDEDGNFRIPLGDPIQSKRVEQLLNSIIKNRVNKQELPGGPVVQVSNYGTSRRLSIRFKNKNKEGELLMSLREYEEAHKGESNIDKQYTEYIEKNQGGVAYFEVFAPMPSNEVFEKFANPDGSIDIDAINATDPELLKMIGYRIPSEDKYSIAPLKIVGFLPREAGDGIMLPYEIVLLTGSDFDVDKEYLIRKDIPIKTKPREEIFNLMIEEISKKMDGQSMYKIKEYINNTFLDNPVKLGRESNVPVDKALWAIYKRVAYKTEPPVMGRTYRDNKIMDMTWEVMTHETTMDKLFNPGGFEPQKRMGYKVSVFKNMENASLDKWEELNKESTAALKDKANVNKNLSFIDTHIQFYKQNNAAGALIGMFAVHKVAHAVLESNGYNINVNAICNTKKSFNIAGMEFGENIEDAPKGYVPIGMKFDMKYDTNGQLIGKVLGSLVASAADAVKDPVLNLMNINGNTANILTALIRMGMPFEDAALFLSQSTITKLIDKFNSENITNYKSLNEVLKENIKELEKEYNIDASSPLYYEPLTKEELIMGLRDNVKPEIAFKVLINFRRIQQIAEALRGPSYATRFNSISNSVGPLIIDNIIMEHKLSNFSNQIRNKYGEYISILDVFKDHPILKAFYRTLNMSKTVFNNMPSNSSEFREVVDFFGDTVSDVIYNDRKLLGQLSDFYQSYLLVASGVIKESELKNYIEGFPKYFVNKKYKEKYPDNPLIQAITLSTDPKTDRAVLEIKTTGLDTQDKELLSAGWIDLQNTDPELSTRLFMYNFFKGGITFSPKTFMGLVPAYVKERIKGYNDTYRKSPQVIPDYVVDQFVRNNWENNKVVPVKNIKFAIRNYKGKKYFQPLYDEDFEAVEDLSYFKTKSNTGEYQMYKLVDAQSKLFIPIEPLGNNKEYLEISTKEINSPMTDTDTFAETPEDTQLQGKSNQEVDNESALKDNPTEQELEVNTELLYNIIQQSPTYSSKELAEGYIQGYKLKSESEQRKTENAIKKFLRNKMEKMNLTFKEEDVNKVYKLMC